MIENHLRFGRKGRGDFLLPHKKDQSEKHAHWDLWTEASFIPEDGEERISIRAHPNYRNEGAWHDWVMVRFDTTGQVFEHPPKKPRTTQYDDCFVPCKVLALANDPETKKVMALVHACQFRNLQKDREMDSVLLERWELCYKDHWTHLPKDLGRVDPRVRYKIPELSWVPTNTILCRCFVMEEEPGIFENVPTTSDGKYIKEIKTVWLTRRRDQWPAEFTGE